jgi:hypothetical protein
MTNPKFDSIFQSLDFPPASDFDWEPDADKALGPKLNQLLDQVSALGIPEAESCALTAESLRNLGWRVTCKDPGTLEVWTEDVTDLKRFLMRKLASAPELTGTQPEQLEQIAAIFAENTLFDPAAR